jgi:hypothetical protein
LSFQAKNKPQIKIWINGIKVLIQTSIHQPWCFSLGADNFLIILDSFMTYGEHYIYSYWDLGRIPTSHLFRIGLWWHTTASHLPGLPWCIHDATGVYTGKETYMVFHGHSL